MVYDRLVNPWVDEYESMVDDAADEAHRSVRRCAWSRLGGLAWILIGEGGSLAGGVINLALGILGVDSFSSGRSFEEERNIKPSDSTELLPPLHSVKEALSQSSSMEIEDVGDRSFDPTDDFVSDFTFMLQQGLYVFANVDY